MATDAAGDRKLIAALTAAQLYYMQDQTMDVIARELGTSRSSVSRLLSFAREVGLPDVIAHGMLTMAKGAKLVTAWVGDPARIEEYGVRFAKPVVVPDTEDGASVTLTAKVGKKLQDGRVRVDVEARCGDEKVLSLARAVVRLS